MLTPLLALVVALAGLVAIKLTGTALPGQAIRTTDYSYGITTPEPSVGDTVLFMVEPLDIAPGTTIEVVRITSAGTGDLRATGGRIYEKRFFGNAALVGWQSNRGEPDPRARPSTDLVGSRLAADPDYQRFFLLEFLVCAAGDSTVDTVDVVYSVGGFRYEQTLHVSFGVRDAQPSDLPCPRR
jgi:hypothetical protein